MKKGIPGGHHEHILNIVLQTETIFTTSALQVEVNVCWWFTGIITNSFGNWLIIKLYNTLITKKCIFWMSTYLWNQTRKGIFETQLDQSVEGNNISWHMIIYFQFRKIVKCLFSPESWWWSIMISLYYGSLIHNTIRSLTTYLTTFWSYDMYLDLFHPSVEGPITFQNYIIDYSLYSRLRDCAGFDGKKFCSLLNRVPGSLWCVIGWYGLCMHNLLYPANPINIRVGWPQPRANQINGQSHYVIVNKCNSKAARQISCNL